MLCPRKTKYRKYRKGRINTFVGTQSVRKHSCVLGFGSFGLTSLVGARLTARQLEAGRRVLRKKLNRSGRLWVCVFPDTPVTSKPTGVRMGQGKGSVDYWTSVVRPGQVIFEVSGMSPEIAFLAIKSASKKFSFKTSIVSRLV
jgi:large subunit ribosomal protein L16